uniref:Uncharacterized protein n=1 Tax=Physcomitrium patens TaxID=3218 RepID=A0A2K1J2Y1_PHYPA|nr:hypothetical protein PHYPA_021738 [Physcomitrium patens]
MDDGVLLGHSVYCVAPIGEGALPLLQGSFVECPEAGRVGFLVLMCMYTGMLVCVFRGNIAEFTTPPLTSVRLDMVTSSFPVAYIEFLSVPLLRLCGIIGPWDSTPQRRGTCCLECVLALFFVWVAQ